MSEKTEEKLTLMCEILDEVFLTGKSVHHFRGKVPFLTGINRLVSAHTLFDHFGDLIPFTLLLIILATFKVTVKHSNIHCFN